ncbi:hypothetical protein NDU88_001413 [Pleurodeles waltl]|uniref:Uncharacterized protein n=1 Tax=Pleurodeles waltl TaxID=8319 RepID=A0AAV7W0E9_PLEWA|nr:hypothetical protein NDU88_001413 [Pleurodeles waltl]
MALQPLGPAPASRASGRRVEFPLRPIWPRLFRPPGREQEGRRGAAARDESATGAAPPARRRARHEPPGPGLGSPDS